MDNSQLKNTSMNIYSPSGTKVVYSYPKHGYTHDQETAAAHLKPNETYTVDRTEVGDWRTGVWLVEVPDIRFNSVMFSDAQ